MGLLDRWDRANQRWANDQKLDRSAWPPYPITDREFGEVMAAVVEGREVGDRSLAQYAVDWADEELAGVRRPLRWMGPILVATMACVLFAAEGTAGSAVTGAVLGLVAAATVRWILSRSPRRARRANLALLGLATPPRKSQSNWFVAAGIAWAFRYIPATAVVAAGWHPPDWAWVVLWLVLTLAFKLLLDSSPRDATAATDEGP